MHRSSRNQRFQPEGDRRGPNIRRPCIKFRILGKIQPKTCERASAGFCGAHAGFSYAHGEHRPASLGRYDKLAGIARHRAHRSDVKCVREQHTRNDLASAEELEGYACSAVRNTCQQRCSLHYPYVISALRKAQHLCAVGERSN